MHHLTKALLGGVAFCALAALPAVAENTPGFHLNALHGGRVVNKTKMPNHGATHITYTFGVYTYLPASTPLHTKLTFDVMGSCPAPDKVKISPKKTKFATTSLVVETYSGCADVVAGYTLVKQPSPGDTDAFKVGSIDKFKSGGTKYKETLNLEYDLEFN